METNRENALKCAKSIVRQLQLQIGIHMVRFPFSAFCFVRSFAQKRDEDRGLGKIREIFKPPKIIEVAEAQLASITKKVGQPPADQFQALAAGVD